MDAERGDFQECELVISISGQRQCYGHLGMKRIEKKPESVVLSFSIVMWLEARLQNR